MSGPAWKRLADQLESSGMNSPYHARVRARLSPADSVAVELMQEMASALRRSEEKVSTAIAELDAIDADITALRRHSGEGSRPEVRARIEAWNKQRDAAAQALWELRVHREAIGFRQNADLAERYPIPPKRRPIDG